MFANCEINGLQHVVKKKKHIDRAAAEAIQLAAKQMQMMCFMLH